MSELKYPDDYINKIICGDCLTVMKGIPDKAVDLVITSPPYNMRTRIRNGKYTTREKSEHFSKKYQYWGDDLPLLVYYEFHKLCLLEMFRISTTIFWNVSIVTGSKEAIFRIIGDFSTRLKDIIVWDKGYGQPAMHNSVINRATELILIFESKPTAGRAFNRSCFERGKMADIWRIAGGDNFSGHGACFPLSLVGKILNGWSWPGNIILDPFIGSGTTAVAARRLDRRFVGIDISQEYCEIARKRLEFGKQLF